MDIATLAYILPVLLFFYILIPSRFSKGRAGLVLEASLFFVFTSVMLFASISEWLFWDEIGSRYNFIAVDYLVYMDEVLGDIRETYPVAPIIAVIAAVALMGTYLFFSYMRKEHAPLPSFSFKLFAAGAASFLLLASFQFVSAGTSDYSENHYNNEIAKNGIFALFSAFRHNELDYKRFYITENSDKALANLRQRLQQDGVPFIDKGLTRHIDNVGEEIHPNVVLITVESLSAEYMAAFGNGENLTPNLDQLAKESLFFTNLYAIGTRTVYGLTGITLSIPPIPGNAIARRPENSHLFSLGAVLGTKGYDSRFIYGGYGYFDNMNAFFGGNGYRVIDRSNLEKSEITFANIWGVCDEDIYNRTLKENDASFAKGQPFFDMIMTTSNHQPFTYPDGKIDMKFPSGRRGGVKYTDYAIGKFITDAKTRPWFDNTIFIIIADHTAGSSGKMELTPSDHHIPMLIYAQKFVAPTMVKAMASQIDLAPTLLGLMHMDYDSRFYGHNIMESGEERAFIANYQRVALLKPDTLVVLKPVKGQEVYTFEKGNYQPKPNVRKSLVSEAVAYFQTAAQWQRYNAMVTDISPHKNQVQGL